MRHCTNTEQNFKPLMRPLPFNTAIQLSHKTLQLIVMYHKANFRSKWIGHSENIVDIEREERKKKISEHSYREKKTKKTHLCFGRRVKGEVRKLEKIMGHLEHTLLQQDKKTGARAQQKIH